jgi:hypothetical protein
MERLMSDDVRGDLSELAALHLRDACKLVGSSEWKMRKEIERRIRKLPRRKQAQGNPAFDQSPPGTFDKSPNSQPNNPAAASTPQPPNARRGRRPRKPETAATSAATTRLTQPDPRGHSREPGRVTA